MVLTDRGNSGPNVTRDYNQNVDFLTSKKKKKTARIQVTQVLPYIMISDFHF